MFFGVLDLWVFDFEFWVGVKSESFFDFEEKEIFFWIGSMGLI